MFVLALLLTTSALSQTKPAPPEPAKAPVLTDTLKAKYWRVRSEADEAQATAQRDAQVAQQKAAALNDVVKALQDACGKDFAVQLGSDGEPTCAVKPKEPAKGK